MVLSKYCTSSRGVYFMSLVSILSIVFVFLTMIGMKEMHRDRSTDMMLVILFIIFYTFAWIVEEVNMTCMLAQMVPSHCQSLVESCRSAVSRLSTIVASLSAPLVVPYL